MSPVVPGEGIVFQYLLNLAVATMFAAITLLATLSLWKRSQWLMRVIGLLPVPLLLGDLLLYKLCGRIWYDLFLID